MKRKVLIITACLLLSFTAVGALLFFGVIHFNDHNASRYEVTGVDVSAYQGKIDWKTLASQEIDFAFIKATEGSSFVDDCFAYNYAEAQQTNLRIGAYHFFSFDSAGTTQAENFIRTVEAHEGMLPPVIDFEFYADKEKNPPNKADILPELTALISALEAHYEMKPILYATPKAYRMYLADEYPDCDIWIRDVVTEPSLPDGRSWTFWQYTSRQQLNGYDGEERYIDMNVFYGTAEEFATYGQ